MCVKFWVVVEIPNRGARVRTAAGTSDTQLKLKEQKHEREIKTIGS